MYVSVSQDPPLSVLIVPWERGEPDWCDTQCVILILVVSQNVGTGHRYYVYECQKLEVSAGVFSREKQ